MEVAMVADLHRTDRAWQRTANVSGNRGACLQDSIGQGLLRFGQIATLLGQKIKGAIAALDQAFDPRRDVCRADRPRREIRNVGPAGQCGLQLAGPAPDLCQQPQIGSQLRAFRQGRCRQHALIVDETAEVGFGDSPGVAWFPMKHAPRRRASPIASNELDRAQQVRNVAVSGLFDR
jgi:hypothetical protein